MTSALDSNLDDEISDKGFNATVFQCIDRALSTLGDSAKLALFHQMETVYGLKATEFRSKPLDVAENLHKILGDVGYSFLEKLMLHEIKSTFKVPLRDGIHLPEAVAEARKKFLGSGKLLDDSE